MSKQYETGHARNVANFEMLIEQVTTYTAYNPSVDSLKIPQLTTLYNSALTNLNGVKDKRIANKNAIANRQTVYEDLKPKTTRIINYLDILGLNDTTIKQAKSLNHLIQGYSKKKEKEQQKGGQLQEIETKSTSRQSYTQIAENFSKLLQLISTIPPYNPNTDDIKLAELTAYHTALVDATQQVNQTEAELKTMLMARNSILYTENEGLYDMAFRVKKYVKSLYGATSPEYKSVSNIKFTEKKY